MCNATHLSFDTISICRMGIPCKMCAICNKLNQFTHLSSASGAYDAVIKMAVIILLMDIIGNQIQSIAMYEFLARIQRLSLFD